MTLSEYQLCLRMARRHARSDADAADLLHEALLAGVRAGRLDFTVEADRAWLSGVLRNTSAATARGAARRKDREQKWAGTGTDEKDNDAEQPGQANELLSGLSEGSRQVAVLALHGLNPDEICFVLRLKPAAFRQRLTALRRSLGQLPEPLQAEARALAYTQPRREEGEQLDFGLIRRALMHHVRGSEAIGTHDPDGHLVGIRTR